MPPSSDVTTDWSPHLQDIPYSPDTKLTVECRGTVVLLGINRPYIQNRLDPETFRALAKAYFDYECDESLRVAVLFGHGPNFSQGIDVDGFSNLVKSGKPCLDGDRYIDPLGKSTKPLSKPLIVVVHGDTWNMGHEIHLVADIRIASSDTRYGQDETSHARFPGGGGTVRFVREAGWGNAMRYMLTGDHWDAQEAFRMGVAQQVVDGPEAALASGIAIANKIAQCGPLGVKMTLASARTAINESEPAALAKLDAQYSTLYQTEDFLEGRKAEAENRTPVFHGR
jgi:enoyl-CoA hydratase